MPGHRTFRMDTHLGVLECFKFVLYDETDGVLRALEPAYVEWRINGSEISVYQAEEIRVLMGDS